MLGQVLTVSGNPAVLSITTAVAGSQPVAVSDNSTTYTVTAVVDDEGGSSTTV